MIRLQIPYCLVGDEGFIWIDPVTLSSVIETKERHTCTPDDVRRLLRKLRGGRVQQIDTGDGHRHTLYRMAWPIEAK